MALTSNEKIQLVSSILALFILWRKWVESFRYSIPQNDTDIGVRMESNHLPSLYVGPNFEDEMNRRGGMTLLPISSTVML